MGRMPEVEEVVEMGKVGDEVRCGEVRCEGKWAEKGCSNIGKGGYVGGGGVVIYLIFSSRCWDFVWIFFFIFS